MSAKLRELRLKRNWKQTAVAEMLGTRQPYYSKVESGENKMPKHWPKELAKIYGVSPAVFLSEPPEIASLMIEYLLIYFGPLTADQLNEHIKLLILWEQYKSKHLG